LRLACVREQGATLWSAGHLLMQKFPAPEFEVTTLLRFSPAADGDRVGLVVFGHDYAWLGLCCERARLRLVLRRCDAAHQGGAEQEVSAADFAGDTVHLRVSVSAGGHCRFAYSAGGGDFQSFGPAFQAKSSYWVGAKVGLFAAAPAQSGHDAAGHADVSSFRITPLGS
jgi:beta-xylosidase